jgi:hypothetical protein
MAHSLKIKHRYYFNSKMRCEYKRAYHETADAQNGIKHDGRSHKTADAQNGRCTKRHKAQNGIRHKTADGTKQDIKWKSTVNDGQKCRNLMREE